MKTENKLRGVNPHHRYNSKRGRITYTVCKIIIAYWLKIAIFAYSTQILDPSRGTTTISM